MPKETVFLPHSARGRSVQFFPPAAPGCNAVVIVGPRYGQHPGPSIGLYPTEGQLGGWVPIDYADSSGEAPTACRLRTLEGHFEEFDEEEDCDLIPFE